VSYLSAKTHANISGDPSLIAEYYARVRSTFLADLGENFQHQCENHFKLAFCSVVSFDLKPYGNSSATELADLLAAPSLDCDNYVLLAWQLYELTSPDSGTEVVAFGVERRRYWKPRSDAGPDPWVA
jgi:hypothetical protein